MIYIPQVQKRIEELHPRWERGKLSEDELNEFYDLLDEVVKEARKRRTGNLARTRKTEKYLLPERFLLSVFKKRIKITVSLFFKPTTDEQTSFRINRGSILPHDYWLMSAYFITSSIIVGDAAERLDRREIIEKLLENTKASEEKHLNFNYKPLRSHRDYLLGEHGTHKKKDFLARLESPEQLKRAEKEAREFDWNNPFEGIDQKERGDGFLIRDEAAIEAALHHALNFKARSKRNPCFDEPTGYVPGYKSPRFRYLLFLQKMANTFLSDWEKGEYSELETEEQCRAKIERDIIGMSLIDLDKEIAKIPRSRPNLVFYMFGKGERRGELYRRLQELWKFWVTEREKEKPIRQLKDKKTHDYLIDADDAYKETVYPLADEIQAYDLEEKQERSILIREEEIENAKRLEGLRQRLTPKQRQVMELQLAGMSIADISRQLNSSRRNIYKHISKRNIIITKS